MASAATIAITKLIRGRESDKKRLLAIKKKLDAHATTPLDVHDTNHYIQEAAGIIHLININHDKLMDIIYEDEDRAMAQDAEHDAILELFSGLSIALKRLQSQLKADGAGGAAGQSGGAASSSSNTKLPRLVLPTFSGDDTAWLSFRDMFIATVHSDPQLSKAKKFWYLSTSLKGEAAVLINGLAPTDDNYDTAWAKVTGRYENKRQLYFSIMKKFHAIPAASSDNPKSIRALVDGAEECERGLMSLAVHDKWDAFLAFHLSQKLDSTSRQFWEMSMDDTNIPQSKQLLEFLEQRARSLQASTSQAAKPKATHPPKDAKPKPQHVFVANQKEGATAAPKKSSKGCKVCKGPHPHFKCSTFLNMTVPARISVVKSRNVCENCLSSKHTIDECTSDRRCHSCGEKHHSILHQPQQPAVNANAVTSTYTATPTILATAVVQIQDFSGAWVSMRAFLDAGSSGQLLTERAARKLRLKRAPFKAPVLGIGSTSAGSTKGAVSVTFRPWFPSKFTTTCDAFIVPVITDKLPTSKVDPTSWNHLTGLQLADPEFHSPDVVDMLIGVDTFFALLQSKKIPGPAGTPYAIKTKLGWIVAGAANGTSTSLQVHHSTLESLLERYWELEAVPKRSLFTAEEQMAEDHFMKTHSRNESGRYVVEFPFKTPQVHLGSSRASSLRRFYSVERRIHANEKIRTAYQEFMKEYENLGHMKEMTPSEMQLSPYRIFLPHHFVLKNEATMEKFRVVFDASAKTSSGSSLNDAQLTGPTIQATLHSTLMRFRCNPVAFTADVAKMYRQILMAPHHQHLQCVFWRPSPADPIKEYQLQTVTYGTTAAPFLATRVLQQLADDEKQNFPLASKVAKEDFYVDDCLSGARTTPEAREVIRELIQMLNGAGMPLRKFASNDPEALRDVPAVLRETKSVLSMDQDEVVNALGIHWNISTDEFCFSVRPFESSTSVTLTKRVLLSEISRLFDPMGWLAPTVISSKILMQDLWKETTDWDDQVPDFISERWTKFKESMPSLEKIRIPRCICPETTVSLELHGFCDASEKAYAGVLYVRAITSSQGISCAILTSKTRVAPVKTCSIPRLELCGSLLLAELTESTMESLSIKFNSVHAWTDSMVVLDWLNSNPNRWKTFVANRVAKIQEILPRSSWSYVSTHENPADCASRGISPEDLLHHSLWWSGPCWLMQENSPEIILPNVDVSEDVIKEEKKIPLLIAKATTVANFATKFSSLLKLKRVAAYCLRFIFNCRFPSKKMIGPLSPDELQAGLTGSLKMMQREEFSKEIECLAQSKQLHSCSKILNLTPFLDAQGVLRVGGRLENAEISVDQRTPILLPRHHKLTELIIRSAHLKKLHGGPLMTQAELENTYWILRARDAIRFLIKKCVICTRHRAKLQTQMMGNLPYARVNPSHVFFVTGVDYAGPFILKTEAPRSKFTYKVWISLFVCFATRAIHLEIATSLSSDAFLACFKRFVSRRGLPSAMHSDFGTNFRGADKEMTAVIQLMVSEAHNTVVADHLSAQGVKWHFNPPGAPHFGGLWEAGVKSVKYHLRRIVGQTILTLEELSTVVAQIEACLNSRPLTPFSTDPTDLAALTPAHFLIGRPLHSVPEQNYTDVKVNRLDRWQHCQQLVQHFWKRWSSEFITRLQQRPKWMGPQRDVQKDDMVLVKTDGDKPSTWPLARVVAVHPGADGLTRVVTLRTKTGELKRPIVKTVLLPMDIQSPDFPPI